MPNWCSCDLTVVGAAEELDRFAEKAKDGDEVISAQSFVPYPKRYKDLDDAAHKWAEDKKAYVEKHGKDAAEEKFPWKSRPKDGFNQGGYGWCNENWGTKWGLCNSQLASDENDDEKIEYTFECAWSPPTPVIVAMGEQFPELTFVLHYYECGMGFQGELMIEGGEIVKDKCTDDYTGMRGG